MDQYDDVVCTQETYVLHGTAIHEYYFDAVNIRLKTELDTIPASRFVVERTIQGVPICDVSSSVAEAIIVKMTIQVDAKVIELFSQTLLVLKTFPFLDCGLMAWSLDPLRPNGVRCSSFWLLVIAAR